ncbi:MAG: glycoside hydrolase family 3 C-terminal domain-containing protein [Cyclobacteriaceae bacterium]|nr:glycoside hydrolase family 3 C-terminal domain-containing protein [Cyclobacteriaceae bacterium]
MQVYFLVILTLLIGCKNRYSDDPRDLSVFERIAHERTDNEEMEDFIDNLMQRMDLTEKIGQMTQLNEAFFGVDASMVVGTGGQAPVIDSVKLAEVISAYHIGSFLTGGTRSAREWYEVGRRLQSINLASSRNEIPIIFGIDHVHGTNYLLEGTIFPHNMNLAASFNPQLAHQTGIFTAKEAAALGHHWNFAPVLDVGENKLWPRLYETFGEDPYVCSVMGSGYIRGLQETRVGPYAMAACAKHFVGYSLPSSGWDRTSMEISGQRLQETLIPPFLEAIKAGVKSVMVNSGEINGKPVHASYYYLTTLLRDQLGFEGVVITDYMDIIKLYREHKVAENEKEATFMAVMAGIDMSMTPTTIDFCNYLRELVEEDRIPEDRINLSVKRILRLKYRLGLFEHPFPSDEYFGEIGSEEAHQAAKNAAAESIVLIKNERNLLPLIRPGRLVVVGTNADSRMALCGGWTYTWQGSDETLYPESIKTVVQALEDEYENTTIVRTDLQSLRWHAGLADAIVIVTGEKPYAEGWGNIDDLSLPEDEIKLIETAVSTKKPVILILLEGRPRILGELFDECEAVIFAGLPGMFGGEAIAGILRGRINPSAKMSITYPLNSGHIISYNHKHMVFSPLNIHNEEIQRYTIGEFGTGMSYTSFSYADLVLSDTVLDESGKLLASVKVKNTGQREGREAVLWFISDEVASFTRPVRQLKFFDKQFLLPGETKDFVFEIDPGVHLAFPDEKGNPILEPGTYTLSVGTLEASFRLIELE